MERKPLDLAHVWNRARMRGYGADALADVAALLDALRTTREALVKIREIGHDIQGVLSHDEVAACIAINALEGSPRGRGVTDQWANRGS
jgi:hypothetical protein